MDPMLQMFGDDTVSINLGCYAHDSTAMTKQIGDSDFCINDGNVVMYLYSCRADGSSAYNIYVDVDTKIFIRDCKYNNIDGNGNIIIEY